VCSEQREITKQSKAST